MLGTKHCNTILLSVINTPLLLAALCVRSKPMQAAMTLFLTASLICPSYAVH